MRTLNQRMKWARRLVEGKGNKYYPKELIPHLNLSAKDCETCKRVLAENLTIQLNIMLHGGQYKPGATSITDRTKE